MKRFFRSRHSVIAGSVVLLHLGALWLLQTGLIQRAVAAVLPVEILSELIEPPVPQNVPPPPAARKPVWQPATRKTAAPPPPMPIALADPTPAPNAPVGDVHEPVAMVPLLAPVAATPGPPAPSASPHIELPSSDADYLHNPKPAYPANSRRLGEQGKVIVRVLIGSDGTAQKAEVRQSSGFERLDLAALATVQRWRYVPGKRGGVPETMWFSVPVNFVLE